MPAPYSGLPRFKFLRNQVLAVLLTDPTAQSGKARLQCLWFHESNC